MLLIQFIFFCVAICRKPTNMFRSVMMFWAYTTFIFTWILIYHMANTTTSIFVRQVMCDAPENFSEAMYLKRAEWMAGKRCYQFDKSFFPLEPEEGVYDWNTPSKYDAYAAALGQHVPRDPLAHQFNVGVVAAHFGEAMCILIQIAFLWLEVQHPEDGTFSDTTTMYGRNDNNEAVVIRQPSKV